MEKKVRDQTSEVRKQLGTRHSETTRRAGETAIRRKTTEDKKMDNSVGAAFSRDLAL
jgi:hypothetical protein